MSRLSASGRSADVAMVAGRPGEALAALEHVRGDVPLTLTGQNPFTEDYARYLRVEARLALGRDDEALPWLLNGFEFAESEILLRPWIARRLAQIYDRRGDRRQAAREYARVVRLWGRCDAYPAPERRRVCVGVGAPRSDWMTCAGLPLVAVLCA